jgi:hypothetical protein
MASWLAPFDPSREFICRGRSLLAAGKSYTAGQLFDKGSVNSRVLRQLYEARQIGYADVPEAGNMRVDPLRAGPKRKGGAPKPNEGELEAVQALVAGKTKPQLLELAAGLEGVRKDMNKNAIALAVIRAGRGHS